MSMTDLDATILEELVDLDPVEGVSLVRDLVGIFFAEAPERMRRLEAGLSEGDSKQVSQAAHSLRGGAAGLGAVGLSALCAHIEHQARAGDLTGLTAEVTRIREGLPGLRERIEELVQRLTEPQGKPQIPQNG